MMRRIAPITAAAIALLACNTRLNFVQPSPGLSRMTEQHRFDPYEHTNVFSDGRTMREPPEHTMPYDSERDRRPPSVGHANGTYLQTLPIPVTRALLDRGRSGFEAICANCHGVLGDGHSAVAMNLQHRRPPSLLTPREPGRIFDVATHGYGMMPGFDAQLDDTDRWAVVAYVSTLQLSAATPLDGLPENVAAEARRSLQ